MLTRKSFIGPWAGLPVAWKPDYSFDEKTYRGDVARCCEAGVPGVYTGGTTGEFYAQDFDEFKAVTDAAIVECKQARVPVMIGCTSTFTLGVIRRARYARDKGADAVQVALPFWMAVPDSEVVRFYAQVSAAVPGMPISVYETTRAKKALTLAQHKQIHREVPAVIHVKSNANTLGNTPKGCAELSRMFNVFVGEDAWAELGPHGAIGACSSFVYQNPRILLKVFDMVKRKQWAKLKVWTDKLSHISAEGLKPVFEAGCEDSAIDRMLGLSAGFLRTSLICRGPYPSCTPEHLAQFQKWLEAHHPEFLEL